MKRQTLYFVAGAPGSGKTTVIAKLLERPSDFVFFDIDWLADSASGLVGSDIRFAPETWPAYGELWFSVLHAVFSNGLAPVLLTPADPSDFVEPLPNWCAGIEWLLLDCDDETRLARLQQRVDWDERRVKEALDDARALRGMIPQRVDTARLDPAEVAVAVLEWLSEQVRE